MAERRSIYEAAAVGVFTLWLAWSSWEIVGLKSDKNIDAKINIVAIDLVRAIGKVSGNLNTEIERSNILDTRGAQTDQLHWRQLSDVKTRLTELEVKDRIHHGN